MNNLIAVNKTIHPAVKSAFIPGWGESSLLKTSQSRFFNLLELTLWSSCLAFYNFSDHQKLQYQSYAAKYAGINPTLIVSKKLIIIKAKKYILKLLLSFFSKIVFILFKLSLIIIKYYFN